MHPYIKHILVKRDPDVHETTSSSGIVVQYHQKRREENQVVMRWGTIVDVGMEVELLKPEWRVAYNPYDSYEHYDPKTDTMYDVVAVAGIRAYIKQ